MSGVQTWTTRHGDVVEVYRAGDGFRYRVKARNGEIVEQGSEGYARVEDAAEAASRHHPIINDLTLDAEEVPTEVVAAATEELIEYATEVAAKLVTECPECGQQGRYDGRVLIRGRGIYTCPEGHRWQDLDEKPTAKGMPL